MNLAFSSPDDFLLFHWTLVLVNYPPTEPWCRYICQPSQSPPSHLQDYSTCNSAWWFNLFPWFDPNEWCMKNGLLSRGLNPGPLSHESSTFPLDHEFPLRLTINFNLFWLCFWFSLIKLNMALIKLNLVVNLVWIVNLCGPNEVPLYKNRVGTFFCNPLWKKF